MDTAQQCPFRYNLQYNEKMRAPVSSIPLDVGTLCHKCLELKGRSIMDKEAVNYEELSKILTEGIEEKTEKESNQIMGITDIKKKFGFESWLEADNASGMNYQEKLDLFTKDVLTSRFDDEPEWKVVGVEKSFHCIYTFGEGEEAKSVHIMGYIDVVLGKYDTNEKLISLKVKDYKTSKKIYDKTKTTTSLQQLIYGLALYTMYGILPEEYEYDFILINEKQQANTKGYLARGIKKLNQIFASIEENDSNKSYKPNPSPLCYYCNYCNNNPDSIEPYKLMCEYYSLWKPQDKTFNKNKDWNGELPTFKKDADGKIQSLSEDKPKPKRKLIF